MEMERNWSLQHFKLISLHVIQLTNPRHGNQEPDNLPTELKVATFSKMTFSASICKNNEIILFLDQIFIVGNTCPWFKQYLCILKQNYVYVITRSDGKKMLIFIIKSNHRGGWGGNSHLILVHLCRRYFSDPPYSFIPDCRNVYLFM